MATFFDETVKSQYGITIRELRELAECVKCLKNGHGAIEIDQMIEKLEELQSAFIRGLSA